MNTSAEKKINTTLGEGDKKRIKTLLRKRQVVALSGEFDIDKSFLESLIMDLKRTSRNPDILVDNKLVAPKFIEDRYNGRSGMGWRVANCTFYDSKFYNKAEFDVFEIFAASISDEKSDFLHAETVKIKPDYVNQVIAALKNPKGTGLVDIVHKTEYCNHKNLLLILNRFDNFLMSTASLSNKLLFIWNLFYAIKEKELSFYILFTYKVQPYNEGMKLLRKEVEENPDIMLTQKAQTVNMLSFITDHILEGEIPLYLLTNTDWTSKEQLMRIITSDEPVNQEDEISMSKLIKIKQSGTTQSPLSVDSDSLKQEAPPGVEDRKKIKINPKS